MRKQIAQELKISLSTQCQYVVTCHQCFYVNGVISIALEYMDGGSLADFLKTVRTVPEDYLAAICKQASEMSHKQPYSFFAIRMSNRPFSIEKLQISRAGVERTDVFAPREAHYTPRSETIEYINKSSG